MFLIPLKRVSADNANAELMDRRAEFTELQKKRLHTESGLSGFTLLFRVGLFGVFFDWKIRLCIGDIAVP